MKRMNPVIKGVGGKKRVGGGPPAVAAKVKGYLLTWKDFRNRNIECGF